MELYKLFYAIDNFFVIKENFKYGVIDKNKNIILPITYDFVWGYKKGFFKVELNNKEFWINQDETIKINIYNPKYNYYGGLVNKLIHLEFMKIKDNKLKFII